MYKLLMSLIMSFSLASSNDFPILSSNELFIEPNICEKVYSDCVDECEKRSPNSFANCLTECSAIYEECRSEIEGEEDLKNSKCTNLYTICSSKCEEHEVQEKQYECFSNCENSFDKCLEEEHSESNTIKN